MKKLLGLVFNRWVLIAVASLCVALVVWIVGPLVAIADLRPLQTERSRWITIGVITTLVGLWIGLRAWQARRHAWAASGSLRVGHIDLLALPPDWHPLQIR